MLRCHVKAVRKARQGRKALMTTKRIPITLMWRNANDVHSGKGAIKKEPKAKLTRIALNRASTPNRWRFKKVSTSKKGPKNATKIEAKKSALLLQQKPRALFIP